MPKSGSPVFSVRTAPDRSAAHPAAVLERARRWVLDLYNTHGQDALIWHHYGRISELVARCSALALEEEGDEQEMTALYAAAWFSYSGWLFDPESPLEASTRLATQFLEAEKAPETLLNRVKSLLPHSALQGQPDGPAARILWDAAVALHFGPDYEDSQRMRRQEEEARTGRLQSGREWRIRELAWLNTLRCFTDTGRAVHEPVVRRIRDGLQRRLAQEARKEASASGPPAPSGGDIQTYFRTSYHTQIHLSGIADRKAQMLLSVNAILISVLITVLSYSNLAETRPPLLIPICLFMVFGLGSLVLAVLSARPNVTRHPLPAQPSSGRRQKLLFFGHFTQLPLDDYLEEITVLLREGDELRQAMHRDLYHLGLVLERKFRLLHLAYTLFLAGFLGATASFLLVHFMGY
ncbi:MAG: hypothetical protein J5I41_10095 [Saprospiraceae bacterium]|nr:hypothetical protein [Saprospiraceae bacterium]